METRGGFQPDADSPKIVSIGALTAELATLEVLCLPIDYMSEFSGCAEGGKMAPVKKFFLWIWWDKKNDNGTLISPAIQDSDYFCRANKNDLDYLFDRIFPVHDVIDISFC